LSGQISSDTSSALDGKFTSFNQVSQKCKEANVAHEAALKNEETLEEKIGPIANLKNRREALKLQLNKKFKEPSSQFMKFSSPINQLSDDFPQEPASLKALKSYPNFINNTSWKNYPNKYGDKVIDRAKLTDSQLCEGLQSLRGKYPQLKKSISSIREAEEVYRSALEANNEVQGNLEAAQGKLEEIRTLPGKIENKQQEIKRLKPAHEANANAAIDLYNKLSRISKKLKNANRKFII
jgi:DNA repair exonuclease SbcCD ATPase subunit